MKKFFNLLSCTLLIATSNSLQARPLESIQKSGVIHVATEGAFPPFNMYKGKVLTGFEIELFDAIAKAAGLKTDWKAYAFDSLLIGLGQDRYDVVIASHGVTPEREKAVDFTNPHYCTGGEIVSLAGGPSTKEDLKGKTVAVQVGSTYLQNVEKVAGVKAVKTYPKDTDSMQNLLGKRADAWVTDKFGAMQAAKEHKELKLGGMLFTEKVAIAVSKGNDKLKADLNKALAKVIQDGTYKKISEKYFAQDIHCPE